MNMIRHFRAFTVSRQIAALILIAAFLSAARAQDFPEEIKVGSAEVIDFEFDWARDGVYCPSCNFGAGNSRLSFIDRDHKLWVGYVDFFTGNFLPRDGRAVLVDSNATAPHEIGNGPEWMVSARGSEIVYTRWTDDAPRRPNNLSMGFARMGGDGWIGGRADDSQRRVMPVGTMDPGDATPAVHYQNVAVGDIVSKIYWRELIQGGGQEVKLPINGNDPGMTRRWVPGSRDVIITAPALDPGTGAVFKQVFLYKTATNELDQMTNDPENKLWSFMFRAPEFGNELIFFAMVGGTKLKIYRNLPRPDGRPRWRVVNTITMPPEMPYVSSPEPFVHNGKSYLYFTLSANPDLHEFSQSQVAISGIEPGTSSLRILTQDLEGARARRDPEHFITSNGPYLYYNRYLPPSPGTPQVSEGVYRVDTGLGPTIP